MLSCTYAVVSGLFVQSALDDAPYLAVEDNDEERCYRRQCHLCTLRPVLDCHVACLQAE